MAEIDDDLEQGDEEEQDQRRDDRPRTNKQADLESLPTITLYHPHGFPVDVRGQDRAQVLIDRGYTEDPPRRKKAKAAPSAED